MTDEELKARFVTNYQRLSGGLTPTELARRIGGVPAVIIRACKGRTIPRLSTAVKIADGLGVEVSELVKSPSATQETEGLASQQCHSSAPSES